MEDLVSRIEKFEKEQLVAGNSWENIFSAFTPILKDVIKELKSDRER